jgi:hypothetical protein
VHFKCFAAQIMVTALVFNHHIVPETLWIMQKSFIGEKKIITKSYDRRIYLVAVLFHDKLKQFI